MAIAADAWWEVRTGGSNTNGGGFVHSASGTDYSQQNAAQYTYTDLVIDAVTNTKITSAAQPFTSAEVGNIINITSGTGFTTGRYEVVSVAANVATLDRAVGTVGSTGGNGKLGGAVTITELDSVITNSSTAGNVFWIKDDGSTHTLTGGFTGTKDGSNAAPMNVIGYKTTRGDGKDEANRPTVDCGANSWFFDDLWQTFNIIFTGTATTILDIDTDAVVMNCKITNTSGSAGRGAVFLAVNGGRVIRCEASSTNGYGVLMSGARSVVANCYVHDCGTYGISMNAMNITVIGCVVEQCGTTGILSGSNHAQIILNSTIDGCAEGIYSSLTSQRMTAINGCIISNNTDGLKFTTQDDTLYMNRINFYNNTTNKTNVGALLSNETTLDPAYTDRTNGNFTPGSAMDIGMEFPGGTSNNWVLGAVGYDPGGGGGTVNLLRGKL